MWYRNNRFYLKFNATKSENWSGNIVYYLGEIRT